MKILLPRASSTAEFIERSAGICPNCGDRADALKGTCLSRLCEVDTLPLYEEGTNRT